MAVKIITVHTYPPIPRRDWDWCAYRDGREENGSYGWGETEADAIADLKKIEQRQLFGLYPDLCDCPNEKGKACSWCNQFSYCLEDHGFKFGKGLYK